MAIRSAKTAAERSRKDAGLSESNVNSAIQVPFPAPGLLCAADVSPSRPARRARESGNVPAEKPRQSDPARTQPAHFGYGSRYDLGHAPGPPHDRTRQHAGRARPAW